MYEGFDYCRPKLKKTMLTHSRWQTHVDIKTGGAQYGWIYISHHVVGLGNFSYILDKVLSE